MKTREEDRPFEIFYLKGLQNKSCRKSFKNEITYNKWLEKNQDDIEVKSYCFLDE